jgi:predicted dehydrogenase
MDRIRLALIGAGGMANGVHYPSLKEFKDIEIVGLCDIDVEKLKSTAGRFGIDDRYADYQKMIEETKPDAVYILMPPHHLYDLAVHCLSKGLHMFIEKPPGVTSFQARRLANLAQKNGCLTMVGFNRRYIPLLVRVKEMADERGPIVHGVATFYKNMVESPPYYGGAIDTLTCDIIHAVDFLRWICGEPVRVASTLRNIGTDYQNSFNALAEFDSGATGALLSNFALGARIHTFEIHTMGFSSLVNPNDRALIFDRTEEAKEISTFKVAGSKEFRVFYGFLQENRHFIDSINNGTQPMTNLADAARTMEFVDRIHASSL